jgi:hypothetical protein
MFMNFLSLMVIRIFVFKTEQLPKINLVKKRGV